MNESDIPNAVWEDATVRMSEEEGGEAVRAQRMDVIWGYLGKCKLLNGYLRFGRLSRVAQLVLITLHSNASEERVFSIVRNL